MAKKVEAVNKDLLDRINDFFEQHEKTFLWISIACGVIMSILMFDCKVSLSGDDCDYIINAQQFIQHFTYPGGRGALYPMVISPFMIGGLNLLLLKALSAIFIVASMWLMYKAFKGLIPAAVLIPTLLTVNLCPYIFFYASYTYSEPFFMLTQSLFLYVFSKNFLRQDSDYKYNIKTDWSKYLITGLCFMAMGLTRTIGYAVMGAAILYFAFEKQWKNLIFTFSASIIVYIAYQVLKTIIWPESGAAYDITNYMAKNFYNPEQGSEDIPGYINRLIFNSNAYISGFLYKFMGFRSSAELPLKKLPLLTIFTYIMFAVCIVAVLIKNKPLLFTGLYVGVMNFASFVLLQTIWEQDRLIMIYYPLILLFLFGGLFYLLKKSIFGKFLWIYPIVVGIVFLGTCIHLNAKTGRNIPVLQQNIAGNDLYGLTPDWENFVRMSRWANDNFPKDAVIVSRKPSISYIYTGREFRGIFSVPFETVENVIQKYNSEKTNTAFVVLDMAKGILADLSPSIQYILLSKNEGKFSLNNKEIKTVGVYAINKAENEQLSNRLDSLDILYTTDFEGFIKQYQETNEINYVIISPDLLYNNLINSNVEYLLLPRIRLYTSQNTGQFINTIHQYVTYISLKYPGSFNLLHTIGKEEICELVEFVPQAK
jgi:hypothetical protein